MNKLENSKASINECRTNLEEADIKDTSILNKTLWLDTCNNNNSANLNLNMTAKEMRKILSSRKKVDAKKAQIDIRQKYEIIQKM